MALQSYVYQSRTTNDLFSGITANRLVVEYGYPDLLDGSIECMVKLMVVPGGFEPPSPGPKPEMMDRYTTGLRPLGCGFDF